MTDSEILEKHQNPFPVSFKVIGTGTGATDIIEKIKSFGYDCVDCFTANSPRECVPTDVDTLAIVVAQDNGEVANAIAKTYLEAGVFTIGVVTNPDVSCYNHIATDTQSENITETIKHLLQPLVTLICYDVNDLCVTLQNFRYFKTLAVEGKSVKEAVDKMKNELENVTLQHIESISAHLYFSSEKQPGVAMADMKHVSDMISGLPESINVIWSVNSDDTLPDGLIRFTIILPVEEL